MNYDVCALSDLEPDGLLQVEAGSTKLLLARDGDTVFATGAFCTHKGAPLAKGTRVGNHVICPFHHSVFDLESGDHVQPPGQGCLVRFDTEVSGGRVHVEVPEEAETTRPEVAQVQRRSAGKEVFVIVGAGAAGFACAQQLVAEGFDGRILMVTKESEPPYDRTDLSKTYLAGKTSDDDLPLVGEDGVAALGIERIDAEVVSIDRANRTLHFAGEHGPNDSLVYDKCFAAPGSDAGTLPLKNADRENVFTLRSHADARRLKEAAASAGDVVILGSGFIGMEAAAALAGQGKTVTVVSQEPLPFQSKFGADVAGQIAAQHREKGVTILTNEEASELEEAEGHVAKVHLKSGTSIPADLVLVAVGAKPRTALFGEGAEDGVSVDENLSLDASLFVGGDVAKVPLHGRGYAARIEHWRVAEQHGRFAARAMLGLTRPFEGVPFFWSAQYAPIHYVGHARDFDEIHIEGDLAEGAYTAFYVKGGKVVAALGRGGPADTTADLHAVMMTNPTPSAEALAKVGWQPKALIGR